MTLNKIVPPRKLFFSIFVVLVCSNLFAQKQTGNAIDENKKLNEKCLKCHGDHFYELKDPVSGDVKKERMFRVINRKDFYNSNHKTFKCYDCHSEEFDSFPHSLALRFEGVANCLDCHGGDANYAMYKFEQIDEDFHKSVHSTKHLKEFSCWMCHDPHSYKINARNKKQDILKTISYDNSICLSCHANIDKYQLILEAPNPNILEKHEWLPNQVTHFRNVRCIECHARINDSILVAHNIQPKAKAVKRCVQCHSTNSILLQTLYKYTTKERINELGFFNGVILNDSYVVGANRNYYINIACIIILSLTFLGILIHGILRKIKKVKKN
jgi:hypothetical protein